jgi:hypothetical protein
MARLETALQRILGIKPAFTRPPYGSYNNLVRRVADERGQTLVTWDFDSGDSTGSTVAQSNAAYDKLARQHPSTILALNHETYGAYISVFDFFFFGSSLHGLHSNNSTQRASPCHYCAEGARLQIRYSCRVPGRTTLPEYRRSRISEHHAPSLLHLTLNHFHQGEWTC